MSRIGKRKIAIPDGVSVNLDGTKILVKGPKGELINSVNPAIKVLVEDSFVSSEIKTKSKEASAYWGTTMSLINNMIKGVTDGFEKKLEMVGVGFRASISGSNLVMHIGYSHPINFEAPTGIKVEVIEKNILIKGIDKQLVGQTAAKIRAFRKPEPYKGKGIKYSDEIVRRKAGKSGKAK